ncbi:guanine nucleotide binding protein, alpha subunit [Catenaria anguillulae PL171]|uniref:Guanine nucleotide binding protein, alpha subunit n=1 Tax=Catenaria anguillulae PL171 TaxID=765915 RepID=A0A1Y2H8Z6_9FUNG|nr:guanine nucleotide binding protein, alpha subunit [Catenaria anguillulae PL171]
MSARQARKVSADIDRQLKEERKREEECIRLLFLGTAESGKSTCLKQMKLIHNGNIVDKDQKGKVLESATAAVNGDTRLGAGMMDAQAWAGVLRTNLFDSLEKILGNVGRHSTGFQSAAASSAAETLLGILGPLRDNVLAPPPDLVDLINTLLADPSVQTTIGNGAKYYLLDSAPRLLQDSATILSPTFVPTNEHILLARLPTSTITETRLTIDGFRFKIYDVNGAHGKRQAWMPFFDFCTAVIYVSAISQFDQPLPEDPTITRLHDSLMVFETVINHPLMAKPAFVLFLNKIDVLKQKLDRGIQVKSTFPDYTGSATQEYEEVCTYFARKFALAIEDKKRKVYIHFTWATSTSQIKTVLKIVQGVIIKLNLAKADLL